MLFLFIVIYRFSRGQGNYEVRLGLFPLVLIRYIFGTYVISYFLSVSIFSVVGFCGSVMELELPDSFVHRFKPLI